MGKGIVKLGEGQWATKDGKLLAAKETNGRFKNAEFTVTRGSDATYTDKDGLIKRVSAPRNRNTTSSNTLDLFVLAGQSNAMGWLGNASGYPPQEPDLLDSSIKLNYEQIGTTSKSDGWQTLGPQQRQGYGEIFGPEVTFSRLLKRGGYNPAIFKYTEGSTSLADDWRAPGQSGHYDTMVTKFNAAVLDLQNQGYTVNIAGFIWIQGEQDATDATDASNYQSNLNAIISDFRTNVASNSTLEFVLGVDEGNPASNISTIVTAQTNIANGDANIVRSSMVGLEKADSTHLTPAGIIDHGKRIYDSMFDLASAEPRIDFTNNTDGHLLLEPQSTNLITYSEDFSEWTLGNNSTLTYESDVVAPDGSLGVYRLKNPATFNTFIQSPSFSSSNPLTVSLYVKSTGSGNGNFNLYTGAANISDLKTATSEWQRFHYTADGSSMYIVNDGDTYVTDIYIWGAQAENLSYPTSYIPTNGSTVTRDAETCLNAGEAADFNSEEGVLYAEIENTTGTESTYKMISVADSSANRITLFVYENLISAESSGSGTNLGIYNKALQSGFNKIALKYKANDCALWVNGTEYNDTSFTAFSSSTLNTLDFDRGDDRFYFYGKVKSIRIYKETDGIDLGTLTS